MMPFPRPWRWPLVLLALFAFRLFFGLSSRFFTEDETQIFLIGFRYYATGHWPYFGPDVVWTKSEIPGALQGVLIAWPLSITPAPEAPIVLLNLLSFGGLAALAFYISRRLPSVPRWLIWAWTMTVPWTLQFSTHITNPSYVLVGAVAFFIGLLESLPSLRIGLVPIWVAFFLMGAGTTWILQIHMSWYLLPPFLAVAFLNRRSDGPRALAAYAAACALGAAIPGLALMPTLLRYGALGGQGGTLRNLHVHWVSPKEVIVTAARFLSFPSLEVNRFVDIDDAKKILFFWRYWWLAPVAAVVVITGLVQPLWMLASMFRSRRAPTGWTSLRWLVAFTVGLIYISYWFVIEPPQAHAFYLAAPLAFVVAAYCWTFIDSPKWRRIAGTILAINVVYQLVFACIQFGKYSLYTDRQTVAEAITRKEPEMFSHRRAYAIDPGPTSLTEPSRPYDAVRDVEILDPLLAVGFQNTANWTFSIRNNNPKVAFGQVLYITTYRDENDRVIEERYQFITRILQPGEVRRFEVNDGFVNFPYQHAVVRVAAAEALLPRVSAGETPRAN